jgi:hypothetical protein
VKGEHMSIEVISFILLRIMPVIFIICFASYLANALKFRSIAFRYPLDTNWIPYECKASICLAEVILLMCVDLLKIKNLAILIVILVFTVILLVWIIFTNIFYKQEEKNRLYRELIYVWNQEDLTDFQKHMSHEEQIAFLKSIKKTQTVSINGKEEEIYEEIHLIADDAQLKLFEPILRKK